MIVINRRFTLSPAKGKILKVAWNKSPKPSKKFLNIASAFKGAKIKQKS
jgi:hypothetical protein